MATLSQQLSVCLLTLTCCTTTRAEEPGFLGRPMSQWVQDLDSGSPRVRKHAAFALGQLGSRSAQAAPQLIRALNDENASVRDAAAFALGSIAFVHALLPDDVHDATPVLLRLLQHDVAERVRRSAALALGALRVASAEPALRMALRKDQAAMVRQNAAWALGHLGTDLSPDSIEALQRALHDPDLWVQRDAKTALALLRK